MQRSERLSSNTLVAGRCLVCWLLLAVAGCSDSATDKDAAIRISLGPGALEWIGQRVFQNECAGDRECLVHWNAGENFPSLGIGHFIWYPTGVNEPFVESFPRLIEFLSSREVEFPELLTNLSPFDAPWHSRQELLQTSNTRPVQELRDFLVETRRLQAEFLVQRASLALARVIAGASKSDRSAISRRIERLVGTAGGVYAVIDYVNFKGEGLSSAERYNGEGWGLLQVLQAMDDQSDRSTLAAFRRAAAEVLARRADNAERAIERQQWLAGWLNRIDTYREPE